MEKNKDAGILLESGTNELEIVEFQIDEKNADGTTTPAYYGVNVSKVREIIRNPDELPEVPHSNSSISGVINLRGKIIPIVNLPRWIGKDSPDSESTRVIIMEFNRLLTGFMVHSVTRIHRVSWEKVESPGGVMNQPEKECVTGIVKFDDRIMMMLDFERIVTEINPQLGFSKVKRNQDPRRKSKTIFIAEDSAFVSKMIVDILEEAGYRVFTAQNGKEALTKLTAVADQSAADGIGLEKYINLIITDVEMPQMDGLHLTTQLKSHKTLASLPIIVFSSIVSNENKAKWQSLGVEEFIAKPDINQLVSLVDKHVLK